MNYPDDTLLSRERIAGDFDVCVRTIINWERACILPQPVRLGRTVRHRGVDVNAALDRMRLSASIENQPQRRHRMAEAAVITSDPLAEPPSRPEAA